MTCKHCCGADQLFDRKGAEKDLRKYLKKGPGKPTQKLIDLLFGKNAKARTLIDIGGGIGAVQWAFLNQEGEKTIDIDASGGYLSVAEEYAVEQGFAHKVAFRKGDFVDLADEIPESDFVSLDKVICCYPDYRSLLGAALNKCKTSIGLVYPYGGAIARLIIQIQRLYTWIRRIPFNTYIHEPAEVSQFIKNHGFEMIEKTTSFPWHVQVYSRKKA